MVRTLHFHCRGHGFDPWSGELRSCMPCGVAKKESITSDSLVTTNKQMGVGEGWGVLMCLNIFIWIEKCSQIFFDRKTI